MKISPQITQINTDYKKIKKISVISVICGLLFSSSPGEGAASCGTTMQKFTYSILFAIDS